MIRAKWTREGAVRYQNGLRTWYRAVLCQEDVDQLRTSRKTFQRSRDARAYRDAALSRLENLRNG